MGRDLIPTFPARLVEVRLARGLTQAELAAAAGTSLYSVSKLERGERSPSLRLARDLAEALALPVDALCQPAGHPLPAAQKRIQKK